MKKGPILATAAMGLVYLLGITAAYAAEQYQTEISTFYNRIDGRQDLRTTMYGITGEVFFAPVNTEEHPYAEAAFFERIGSVAVTAAKEEAVAGSAKDDGSIGSIGINLMRPGFPLAAQIRYTGSRVVFDDFTGGFTLKGNSYDIRAGNYFTKTLLAGLEYSFRSLEASYVHFPSHTARFREYGLFVQYVYELTHFKEISIEAAVGEHTVGSEKIVRNTNESVGADYFFSKSLSIGLGFQNRSGTDELNEGKTYTTAVRYFINPNFSVRASYGSFRNSNPGQENDRTYHLILAGRF